jgi:hypothetical protein
MQQRYFRNMLRVVVLACIGSTSLAAAANTPIAAASSTLEVIESTLGWQQTALVLQQGEQYTISYDSGTWTIDYRNFSYVGPEGYAPNIDGQIANGCKVDITRPYGYMLGRVGNGSIFPVGPGGTFIAETNGALYLRINDNDGCLADNDSAVEMLVGVPTDTIDIEVTAIQPTLQTFCTGTTGEFQALLLNNGSIASGGFNIRWIADGVSFNGSHLSIGAGNSDQHGHIWQNLASGQHVLQFIADPENSIAETNEANNQRTITFTCTPPPPTTYSISGSVSGANDAPIADVTVTAVGVSTKSSTTDTNGNYMLSNLAAGTYTLSVAKKDYTFHPTSLTITVPASTNNKNFKGYDRAPIVFVHGWNGLGGSCAGPTPETYFEKVDDDLRTAGYYVEYAHLTTSSCYTPHITENVGPLVEAIRHAKDQTGQERVILIAHSMGGLVARAYLESTSYANAKDVSQLFTFGSPHLGVPEELLIALLGPRGAIGLGTYCLVSQPAVCDFSMTGMTLFNSAHKKRQGVTYHLISGDAPFFSRNGWGMAMAAIIPGGDDGIVPTINGVNLPNVEDRLKTDELHSSIFSASGHNYFNSFMSWNNCLKPVLIDRSTQQCGQPTTEVLASEPPPLSQHTPFAYGTLSPGQSSTRMIGLTGGPSVFSAMWTPAVVAASLIDPHGQIIDATYATAHPDQVIFTADATSATYYVLDAQPGMWKLVLQLDNSSSANSDYMTFAAFDSPISLDASTDALAYAPTSQASIQAHISGATNASVTATILRPDGKTDTLLLNNSGPSQYVGSYRIPATLGYIEIRIVAITTTASGLPIERSRTLLIQVHGTLGAQYSSYLPLAATQ